MAWNRSRAKYGNRKVVVDGITFDSKKEAQRYTELKSLEKAGKITGLQLQREFELIPEQREKTDQIYTKGKTRADSNRESSWSVSAHMWLILFIGTWKTTAWLLKMRRA